jgi:hypothetical protein
MKSLLQLFFLSSGQCVVLQKMAAMNAEVYESYKKPDRVCIYVYKLLTTYAADALFVNQLKKVTSHLVNLPRCFYINKTPPALGKRLAYSCVNSTYYLKELTSTRTAQLQEGLDGTLEGDDCNGFASNS